STVRAAPSTPPGATACRSPSPPPTATTRASAGSAPPAPRPRIARSDWARRYWCAASKTCAACPKPASSPGSDRRSSTPRPSAPSTIGGSCYWSARDRGGFVTRALILAAGLGTRLGSLSDERPKPLLPVCDIPLIRYAVALLRGAGIDEIAVNLHHHGELI